MPMMMNDADAGGTTLAGHIRRCFISLHLGHLAADGIWLADDPESGDQEVTMRSYFAWLASLDWKELGFSGVALALEPADTTGRIHVQGYCEHKQMRFATLGNKFRASAMAFNYVRSSKDAYCYCTGTGVHTDKPALERFLFGDFKLHGDTQKADLKFMVELVIGGASPTSLLREHPYAWCVHRDRLIKLYHDLAQVEARGRLDITRPPRY